VQIAPFLIQHIAFVKAGIRRQVDIDNHHADRLGAEALLDDFGLFSGCRRFGLITVVAKDFLKHISYARIIIN